MTTGLVFQIQKFCTDDGPGIRTTVFLKGCPLHCPWCHNPEGLSCKRILAVDFTKCVHCGRCASACVTANAYIIQPADDGTRVHPIASACHTMQDGKHLFRADNCTTCGRCIDVCGAQALSFCGQELSAETVMQSVLADRLFYQRSGGGMTLSGGEPLMQADFALTLLQQAKAHGIHTCVETSLGVNFDRVAMIAPYVDLFLCDVKETDPDRHLAYIGVPLSLVQDNLRRLDALGAHIKLRCPIVPSVNDREEHFAALAALYHTLHHSDGIQLMPYHMLGQGKSGRYGLTLDSSAFTPPTTEQKETWNRLLQAYIERTTVL